MELLAPVGSKESFITAVRAGADAVYLGVPDFNARISASNLNLHDLRVILDHAKEKNVKVFLALNTLIKHEEISAVVQSLSAIEPLSPDALIVQDLGIASIIKRYFPALTLHASTQMAVHNRMGVDFLAEQGFKRAILARELSFAELKIIAKNSPIPIEIFCHGALCFSLSGMCLFSSFIGGLSGNRGRCTQPCRRRWQNDGKHGYLFSPRDLELAAHIGKLKEIGIACLKIEGRMRSSEYVYRTVKAYRMLIDSPEADFENALKEAKTILAGDMAREKTSCLFSGRDPDLFQPQKAQCLGNLIGKVDAIKDGILTIGATDDAGEIVEGDRLRISNPDTDITVTFKMKEFSKEGSNYIVPFGKADEFKCGNPVYKTVDTVFDQKGIEQDIDAMYENYTKHHRRERQRHVPVFQTYTSLISNQWKEIKKAGPDAVSGDSLWVRFDDTRWLEVLPPPDPRTRLVFYLTKDNFRQSENIPDHRVPQMACELPPFIGQRDTALFKQAIDTLIGRGIKKWVINNVSQFGFFKESGCELSAGQFLYTWNAYAAAALSQLGVKNISASWEDDFLNIRKMCGPGLGKTMVVYLYGFPPLVRSRMLTKDVIGEGLVRDFSAPSKVHENQTAASLAPVFESELAILIPEAPVNLFTARKKFRDCGITTFGIDLSFLSPDKNFWNLLLDSYNLEKNLADSVKFNFKRGVK